MSPGRRLFRYFLPYRHAFLVGLVCVVGTAALGLAGPWVLKLAIDDLTQGVDAAKVRFYAALIVALATVGGSSSARRATSSTTCATTSSRICSASISRISSTTARAT